MNAITYNTTYLSFGEVKLKNYVLCYAGNRIQAAYVPTGPANTSTACLYPLLGDALVIFSREHKQFWSANLHSGALNISRKWNSKINFILVSFQDMFYIF